MLAPRRRAAAPHRCAVDQVVVDERRHVHELDRDPGRERWRRSRRRREERERRTQPLPAGSERARADLGDEARVARDGALELRLDLARYSSRPGAARTTSSAVMGSSPRGARRSHRRGAGSARPRSRRARRAPRDRRGREATDARREVRVRLAAREHAACERHEHVEPEPEEGPQDAARPRDLEHRELPAGTQHARELAQAALEIGEIAHAEADRRRVELAVGERERERVALDPLDRAGLLPRALEHPLGEVEPDDAPATPLGLDGEIARTAARIEHAVARPDDLAHGELSASAGRARPSSHGSSRRRPARCDRTCRAPSRARAFRTRSVMRSRPSA